MVKATLQRFIHDKVTFGKLELEGADKDIYTLELPWKDNKRDSSCIPQGIYNVAPYNGNKYLLAWRVLKVPGREEILIHPGNFACDINMNGKIFHSDTKGCILVGFGINEEIPMLSRSKACLGYIKEIVGDNPLSIEVKN